MIIKEKKSLKAVKTYIISTCVEKFKIVTVNAIDEYEPPAKRICNELKIKKISPSYTKIRIQKQQIVVIKNK